MVRWIRRWRDRRAAWEWAERLPDGHPFKAFFMLSYLAGEDIVAIHHKLRGRA